MIYIIYKSISAVKDDQILQSGAKWWIHWAVGSIGTQGNNYFCINMYKGLKKKIFFCCFFGKCI